MKVGKREIRRRIAGAKAEIPRGYPLGEGLGYTRPIMSPVEQARPVRSWPKWARFLRWVAGRLTLAVPFALFFGFLAGGSWAAYVRGFQASLLFSFFISIAIKANEVYVLPRLFGEEEPRGGRLLFHMSTFVVSSMGAAILAALVANLTVLPGFLGSGRSITIFLLYSLVFCTMFMGIGYALSYQRAYLERVRNEEQMKARIEAELRTAASIQRALLPGNRALPAFVEAAAAALPSRTIAGDFLDYFELPGGRLAFLLGDVSGKGPPAAILAAALQGMFSSVAETEECPMDAISRVNRALVRREVESRFATVFHGLLSADGALVTCNAGHNPPLLLRAAGGSEWLDRAGFLLGIFEHAIFDEAPTQLEDGDTLVLFSDGVAEAANYADEQFGEARLLAAVTSVRRESAAAVVEALLGSVRAFVGGAQQADDITVLVIRYRANGARPRADAGEETIAPA
jgi:serine phosphatase RsbU (regulator of sigma subunit)